MSQWLYIVIKISALLLVFEIISELKSLLPSIDSFKWAYFAIWRTIAWVGCLTIIFGLTSYFRGQEYAWEKVALVGIASAFVQEILCSVNSKYVDK